jgi:hypothetical protein
VVLIGTLWRGSSILLTVLKQGLLGRLKVWFALCGGFRKMLL